MKFPLVVMLIASLTLVSCGGGGNSQSTFTTQILSNAAYDGDIALSPPPGAAYTVSYANTTQNVFAGIDPATNVEYRAFLDFPLGGLGGVPIDAIIYSATLDIFISSITPQPLTGTIPIRIDLVAFQPPYLLSTDFDRPVLASITIQPPISASDLGQHVPVDVTVLMREAQRLGLEDFQIRILEDFGSVSPGLIEINDTTGILRSEQGPMLQVSYY